MQRAGTAAALEVQPANAFDSACIEARTHSLMGVRLPELERERRGVETALEELEQQDLISMHRRPASVAGPPG